MLCCLLLVVNHNCVKDIACFPISCCNVSSSFSSKFLHCSQLPCLPSLLHASIKQVLQLLVKQTTDDLALHVDSTAVYFDKSPFFFSTQTLGSSQLLSAIAVLVYFRFASYKNYFSTRLSSVLAIFSASLLTS